MIRRISEETHKNCKVGTHITGFVLSLKGMWDCPVMCAGLELQGLD